MATGPVKQSVSSANWRTKAEGNTKIQAMISK